MYPERVDIEVGQSLYFVFNAVAVHCALTYESGPGLTVTVEDEVLLQADGMPAIGAVPCRIFKVVANAPGRHDLTFNLAPAWGGDAEQSRPVWIFANAPKQG